MGRPKKALTTKQTNKIIKDGMLDAIEKEKEERAIKLKKKVIPLTPLEDLQKHGKAYRGKKELIAIMKGEKLPASALILAHCYQCMGWYVDEGAVECTCKNCALYQKMPYNKSKTKSRVVDPTTIEKRKRTIKAKEEQHEEKL